MTNLVKVLDDISTLYTPVIKAWMNDNPGFYGIDTCIRPDDPRAWPTDDVPAGYANGYSDDKFETLAADQLNALVDRTNSILNSCSVLSHQKKPLSITAHREASNAIRIRVALSAGLGAIHVLQDIHSLGEKHKVFSIPFSQMFITLTPDMKKKHINVLTKLIESGPHQAVQYLQENNLLLNAPKINLMDWIQQLPDLKGLQLVSEGSITRLCAYVGENVRLMATRKHNLERSEELKPLRSYGINILEMDETENPKLTISLH